LFVQSVENREGGAPLALGSRAHFRLDRIEDLVLFEQEIDFFAVLVAVVVWIRNARPMPRALEELVMIWQGTLEVVWIPAADMPPQVD